jgi:hypothetical protein
VSFTLSQQRERVLYYEGTPGAPMTEKYLTHEEMLEIAAQREAANEQEEETTEEDETK